ncbi:MAG: ABC transporter permease [Actinomycetota bacterium]|nr:ABC transporter permease [Actinomycetota bacterium]
MSTLAGPAEPRAAKTGGSSTFTGLWNSVRLIVRRDRMRFALWFGLILLATLGTVAGIPKALPDEASRRVFGQLSNTNPAELLLIGRVFSDSVGGLGAWRVTAYASVGLGLASMFAVLRHTRKEEEEGRREALGGAVLGRNAPLTAAVVVTLLVNALFGVLLGLGAIGMGLPAAGSVVWGVQLASYGAVMTGVGAVLAQLTNGSRAASGIGSVVLAVFYLGRGVADSQNSDALRWASPYGWIENFRPFDSNNVGPLWPIALLTGVLVAIGFLLLTRRDENQGLLPDRPGRATAVRGLAGPFSLALRLNRGVLLGWVIGAGAFGLMISGAAQGATDQISSSPALQGLIRGGKPVDAFFSLIIDLMAEIFTIYAVAVIARLHTEEGQGLAEPVLATRIGRLRWAGGFFTVAAAGVAAVLLATGLGMGLGYGAVSGDWALVWPLVGAVLVRLPAVWVMTGLAAALYGFWPRLTGPVCYALIGVFMLFGIIVQLLSLDPGAMKISPFANVPSLPVAAFDAVPLLWLLLVATVLTLLGVLGLRRRDMHNS